MKDKKFSRLLIRNSLMILVPPVAAIFMVVLVAFRMSNLREYNTYRLDSLDNLETYINSYMLNVSYDASGLKPAGYDYTVDGKKQGEYYYIYQNDHVWLFALNDSGIEKLKNGDTLLNFRITTDDQVVKHITLDLTKSFETNEDNLKGFINPVILNQFEYPFYKIITMRAMLYGGMALFAVMFLYTVLVTLFPSLCSDAAKLSKYGKRREIIRQINEELKDKLLYHEEDAYVTENYLITYLGNGIQVVKLDDVKYLSKHIEDKRGLFSTRKIYKLTASNVDKLYYEHEFLDEEVIDNIIYYIRRDDLIDETEEIERNSESDEPDSEINEINSESDDKAETGTEPDTDENEDADSASDADVTSEDVSESDTDEN